MKSPVSPCRTQLRCPLLVKTFPELLPLSLLLSSSSSVPPSPSTSLAVSLPPFLSFLLSLFFCLPRGPQDFRPCNYLVTELESDVRARGKGTPSLKPCLNSDEHSLCGRWNLTSSASVSPVPRRTRTCLAKAQAPSAPCPHSSSAPSNL